MNLLNLTSQHAHYLLRLFNAKHIILIYIDLQSTLLLSMFQHNLKSKNTGSVLFLPTDLCQLCISESEQINETQLEQKKKREGTYTGGVK